MAIARQSDHSNNIALCGYSLHRVSVGSRQFSLIAGRPHSMGGPELTFPHYMARTYDIHSLEDSESRLRSLIDEADEEVIFLAHNGPHGLGENAHDIWGCDFRAEEGDYGDPDLEAAIRYAKEEGRRVTAVVAGHMHQQLMDGGQRKWLVQRDGTTYINAARVPRIFKSGGETMRHHVSVTLEEGEVVVEELLVW